MNKFVTLMIFMSLGVFAVCGVSTSAFAYQQSRAQPQNRAQEGARGLQDRKKLMPYGQIARKVVQRFDGRIVGQRLSERRGVAVYDLRVLKKDGRLVFVTVNAQTGRIIRTRGE